MKLLPQDPTREMWAAMGDAQMAFASCVNHDVVSDAVYQAAYRTAPQSETQESISDWAVATFGPDGTDARIVARANLEMAELLDEATKPNPDPQKMGTEIADIVIVLCRLLQRHGFNLWVEVTKKMVINRARKWKLDGTGVGFHVKDAD